MAQGSRGRDAYSGFSLCCLANLWEEGAACGRATPCISPTHTILCLCCDDSRHNVNPNQFTIASYADLSQTKRKPKPAPKTKAEPKTEPAPKPNTQSSLKPHPNPGNDNFLTPALTIAAGELGAGNTQGTEDQGTEAALQLLVTTLRVPSLVRASMRAGGSCRAGP